ncbi:MAG: type IV secretion system protein VirB10 [Neisseria sp.]|nr:type IV secretion system protein VirB10 [Neisseria sp.]
MKLFNQFKRKKTATFEQTNAVADGTDKPETLAESVQNEQVEPGMPLNLDQNTPNKNMRRVAFAGVGLIAVGVIVSGLIGFSGTDEMEAEEVKPENAPTVTRDKDFARDKSEIVQADAMAASEALPEGISASAPTVTSPENPPVAIAAPEAPVYQTAPISSVPAIPAPEVDPRLGGDVVVNTGNSSVLGNGDNGSSQTQTGGAITAREDASDGEGNHSGSNNFASRLNATGTASVHAKRRGDATYLLSKGTNIRCGLDTKIVTTQPGFTRCIVSKDVYSANGKTLLIERGSKIIGEQTSALVQGQARVFVLWNEVETPSGVKVSISSPGAGSLGESGHGAYVNYHFWQRFGGALLISLIGDVADSLNNSSNRGNNNNITYENSTEAAQQMATEALKNSINIPPTGTINQGALINIMVARDVNFDKVYELVNPYGY